MTNRLRGGAGSRVDENVDFVGVVGRHYPWCLGRAGVAR